MKNGKIKVKLFHGSDDELERAMNEWFSTMDVEVLTIRTWKSWNKGYTSDRRTVMLVYNDKPRAYVSGGEVKK